jgi:hypothetical protein
MIAELKDTPNTMVGFRATGEITKKDFDSIVLPAVHELVKRTDKLNYLLVLDTAIKNFTIGAWLKDAMLTLNNIGKWNRAAIVSDSDDINTEIFNKVVPGDYKTFTHDKLNEAILWAGEQDGIHKVQVFAEDGEAFD